MDSSTIGAIASVLTLAISIILLVTQVQPPYIHTVSMSPKKPRKGTSFVIYFSFSAPLNGTQLVSIEIPGYKLRDASYVVKSPELAEAVVTEKFTSSPDTHSIRLGFECYAASNGDSEARELIVRWRWHFISRCIRYPLR